MLMVSKLIDLYECHALGLGKDMFTSDRFFTAESR